MDQGLIVCTSRSRPRCPIEGMAVYEVDTERTRTFDGLRWVQLKENP